MIRTLRTKKWQKMGIAAFMFFLAKGLLWIFLIWFAAKN